jgi:hypothetical protein
MHKGLGGGVILCAAPANEHDAAWASVQGIDHKNPRNTLWLSEGQTLDAAIDSVDESAARSSDEVCGEPLVVAFDEWFNHGPDSLMDTRGQAWERFKREIDRLRSSVAGEDDRPRPSQPAALQMTEANEWDRCAICDVPRWGHGEHPFSEPAAAPSQPEEGTAPPRLMCPQCGSDVIEGMREDVNGGNGG